MNFAHPFYLHISNWRPAAQAFEKYDKQIPFIKPSTIRVIEIQRQYLLNFITINISDQRDNFL